MAPFLLVIIALLHSTAAFANPSTKRGFTLELIHRDSIHSPLYPGNLTAGERIRRFVDLSESRLRQLKLSVAAAGIYNYTVLRPEIDQDNGMYFVKIGIGIPATTQHLALNTAADLTWVQCYPCKVCFTQSPPYYEPDKSESHEITPCEQQPGCEGYKCIKKTCHYEIRYPDDSFTKGTLSTEAFTFATSDGNGTIMPLAGLVFGCSRRSSKRLFKAGLINVIGGMLGMNMERISFASQIGRKIKDNRFSYCLARVNQPDHRKTFLQIGGDIQEGPHFAATPIVRSPIGKKNYYLKLHDISVDHKRLNIPPNIFVQKPDGSGGCIIDSSTGVTYLQEDAFGRVEAALTTYFERIATVKRAFGRTYKLKLCYRVPENFSEWPSMTLHFEGADLLLRPVNTFMIKDEHKHIFCFTMLPDDSSTILGAALQEKFRFVFDIAKQQLRFAPENCG